MDMLVMHDTTGRAAGSIMMAKQWGPRNSSTAVGVRVHADLAFILRDFNGAL